MRMGRLLLGLCLLTAGAVTAWSQESDGEIEDAPALTSGAGVTQAKVKETLADDTAAAQLLVVGLRTDIGFSAGRPIDQGFSLPGLRLNVSGEIARYVDYRLSLAPSREFSSVLIPQVLPVDAWVQFRDAGRNSWKSEATILWKAGMFAPTLSPFFSSDLADLPIPDYARTHQATLLFRELGTEITYRPVPGLIDISLGLFNGSGIVALNTNNAKAFTGSVVFHWGLTSTSTLNFGVSGYSSRQSDPGSVNYISNNVGHVFASLAIGEGSMLEFDVVSGRLVDSSRGVAALGVTGTAYIGLTEWFKGYFRAEALRYSPAIEAKVNRVQAGPVFDPFRGVRVFSYLEHLDDGAGASENAIQILVRLTL